MNPPGSISNLRLLFRILAFLLLLGSGFLLLAAVDFDIPRALDLIRATNPVSFILSMSILPLIGFPIAAFYLYAGSAFPWWQAWLCCCIALAINLSLAYPIARYLLRGPLSLLLQRYRKTLPAFSSENQFRVTFLVRSVPGIPFFIQNYLLPLIGIRFVQYWVISWLIQSTFAAGMAAIPHLVEKGGWVTVAMLLALVLLLGILHRIYVPRSAKNMPRNPAKPIA